MTQYVAIAVLVLTSWVFLRLRGRKSVLANLPGPPVTSWFFGNLQEFFDRHCWDYRTQYERQYGRLSKLNALFGGTWIHVWDTKALHAIFVKDQDHYLEPMLTMQILIGPGLFATEGEQHRRQRRMLNPVFSTRHLRGMIPLFYSVTGQVCDAIAQRIRRHSGGRGNTAEVDMLSWMGRTTLEIIGQVGFGSTFDDFTSDEPDEFRTAIKSFFPEMMKSILIRVFLPILVHIGTPAFRRRVVELIPLESVQRIRHISDVLHERSVRIFAEKKAALAKGDEALKHEIGEGQDIMSILLRENVMASREDKLPDDELIAQIALRAEFLQTVEAEGDGATLDFDRLMELPYLEAVCRESFRVYPSVTCLFREATKDMILPLSEPIRMLDGSFISSLPAPKGTRLITNLAACNVDPVLWGLDASEWKPGRWLEPLPKAVEEARVPGIYSHMYVLFIRFPVQEPRSNAGGFAPQDDVPKREQGLHVSLKCLSREMQQADTLCRSGFKFAQIELKVVLFVLLQRFRFEPTGEPIAWNSAPAQYPTVGKVSEDPALPLKVTLLDA
ncbi:cytochrome P450 [Ganoderma sinense ZZ0214-1]|uniref:Cytochrome P450 n=1 Tax=Ganoderma sinense ZZ0214-1 TaxID=1077348 RepID=A0A2G8SF94_9APHY|nr:cytochrome P450 [Ganoderma sinense ZZ0214-1]